MRFRTLALCRAAAAPTENKARGASTRGYRRRRSSEAHKNEQNEARERSYHAKLRAAE